MNINNLEEERKGLLNDLKDDKIEIKDLQDKMEGYVKNKTTLQHQLVHLSNNLNKRKAGDHGAGALDTRPSKKRPR